MATKTVLIADDDQALARALAIRCKELGLEVQTVSDGMQAYDAITTNPPALLILDVRMPAVNGLYLCDELARETSLAPIPTIILTGMSDQSTVRKCERLGAHYVWKGLDTWSQLKAVICELLDLQPAPAEERHEASPADAAAPATPTPDRAAPKVLVIDDDPDVSKAIQLRLRAYGVDVLRAFNGAQGFGMALKKRPAVIIADYTMPEGYGNWLIGRLKEHSLTKEIPIIVLTGRTIGGSKDVPLERSLLSLGACAYLTKPLDFHTLLAELRRYINLPTNPRPADPCRQPA